MTVPNPLLTFVPSEFNTDDGPHVFRAECKFGTVSIVGDDDAGDFDAAVVLDADAANLATGNPVGRRNVYKC